MDQARHLHQSKETSQTSTRLPPAESGAEMIRQLCCTNASDIPKKPGCYLIVSRYRREVYVGSTLDLNKRFRDHLFRLIAGKHINSNIQKTFNKKQILFFHVFFCSVRELKRKEQELINRFVATTKLLNKSRTAAHHHGRNFK